MLIKMKRILLSTVALFAATAAQAGTISLVSDTSGRSFLFFYGPVVAGDTVRLKAMADGQSIAGVYLNSFGGVAVEGLALAEVIRDLNVMTVVPDTGSCSSACFVMFAAGANKYVGKNATVAVHSAGDDNHKENLATASLTFVMARAAQSYGVPENIIGRMIGTPSADMAKLTEADLASMGAQPANAPATVLRVVRNADPAPPGAPVTIPIAMSAGQPMEIAPSPAPQPTARPAPEPAAAPRRAPETSPGPSVTYAPAPTYQPSPAAAPASTAPTYTAPQTRPSMLFCQLNVVWINQTLAYQFAMNDRQFVEQNALVTDRATGEVLSSRSDARTWTLYGDSVNATLRDDQGRSLAISIDIATGRASMFVGRNLHAEGNCVTQ
jgi:hypothetical protein